MVVEERCYYKERGDDSLLPQVFLALNCIGGNGLSEGKSTHSLYIAENEELQSLAALALWGSQDWGVVGEVRTGV